MIVRKYKADDLERLITLLDGSTEGISPYDAFNDHESLLRFAISNEIFHIHVITDSDVVMGFGILRFNGDPGSVKSSGMIYEVFIGRDFRGRGLGKILLNKMIHECKNNGYNLIRLMVNAENINALKLYESIGFINRRIEMTYEITD